MFIFTFSIAFWFIVSSYVEGPLEISFIAEGCPSLNILNEMKWSVGTTELYHSAKKRQHSFHILKAFFVRHSSEYEN